MHSDDNFVKRTPIQASKIFDLVCWMIHAQVSNDKTAKVWSTTDWGLETTLVGHTNGVQHCAFSPDGDKLVTSSWDKTAIVWETSNWSNVQVLSGHGNYVFCSAFAPNGCSLVTASSDGKVRVWSDSSNNE